MRSDRDSAIEQADLPHDQAIARELELATDARLKEAQAGATRFAQGDGRHGALPAAAAKDRP